MKYIFSIIIALMIGLLSGQVIFEQDFNVSSAPAGWIIGGSIGTGHTDPGVAKTNADFFKNDGGNNYLRLSEATAWNRAWAYYAAQKFPILGHWKLTMEVRIGKLHDGNQLTSGADGLTFIFANANTVETAGALDPLKVRGGYGQYMGAPRGGLPNSPVDGALGFTPGFLGYSFEFDHFGNSNEPSAEYFHWVSLKNWAHSGLGLDLQADTSFYYNNGWQRVELEANNGIITIRYKWNGSSYANTYVMNTFSPLNPSCDPIYAYDAYLGIGAATGQRSSAHEVRYVKLEMLQDETLPITLSAFTALQSSPNQARLNWTTQSETGVSGFYIFRSRENSLESASIVSPMIPATNSATTQSYQFVDSDLYEPGIHYYWLYVANLDGRDEYYGPVQLANNTSHSGGNPAIPLATGIGNIYPNPFNPTTTISYSLKSPAEVRFELFNSRGQRVFQSYHGSKEAGNYKLIFEGRDSSNQILPSGIYVLIMKAGAELSSRKIVLSK